MKNSMNQEASIYILVLIYFARCFEQAEEHVKATFQYYKKPLFAGQSLVKPQLSHMSFSTHSCFEKTSQEQNLNRFWEVEPMESSTVSAEQQPCEEHFLEHTTQQPGGRFVVKLPIKMESSHLGLSCLSAERRLHAIECRLERDPNLKDQYHRFMKENGELGHMEPIKSQEGRNTCYYLPHHPVFKGTNSTTRTRVVFDGSAKTSNEMSLNDILQVGPTVQPDLYSIVFRFRNHQVCFTADITKMYCQIFVHPQD
jgi:hypothetical protein